MADTQLPFPAPSVPQAAPILLRGTLAWLLLSVLFFYAGPKLVGGLLPTHAALAEFIGIGFAVQASIVEVRHEQKIRIRADAEHRLLYGRITIPKGSAWQIDTGLSNITQTFVIALVIAVALPVYGWRQRALLVGGTLALCLLVQFLTIPPILAAGVEVVVQEVARAKGEQPPTSLLLLYDQVLQNGGIWALTLIGVALLYLGLRRYGPAG